MITVPKQVRLADQLATASLRETRRAIEELSALPAAAGRYLTVDGSTSIVLTNGAVNRLLHGMGRPLEGWRLMGLKGATGTGRIVEVVTDGGSLADPSTDLWLDVQGHGADITVRLWVE